MDPDVFLTNGVWCRILIIPSTYLLLSGSCWLLCEAVYLIMIMTLVKTLLGEKSLLKWITLTGWAAPIPMMIPYISYRLDYENTNCWMQEKPCNMLLHIAVLIILLMNIIALAIVGRMIIKPSTTIQQLHRQWSSTSSLPSSLHSLTPRQAPGLRQASLAVLMLAPVFGLHLLLVVMASHPATQVDPDSAMEKVHAIISSLSSSTQGLVVSYFLCFSNKEAMTKTRIQLKRKFLRHTSMRMTNRSHQEIEMRGQNKIFENIYSVM